MSTNVNERLNQITEVIISGCHASHQPSDASTLIDGQVIENVKSFIYLVSEFTWDNDCSKDIQRRITLATAVYSKLQSIQKDSGIMIDVKLQLLMTIVFPVLLYAAETWTVNKEDEKSLLAFEMRCYRRVLAVRWQGMVWYSRV